MAGDLKPKTTTNPWTQWPLVRSISGLSIDGAKTKSRLAVTPSHLSPSPRLVGVVLANPDHSQNHWGARQARCFGCPPVLEVGCLERLSACLQGRRASGSWRSGPRVCVCFSAPLACAPVTRCPYLLAPVGLHAGRKDMRPQQQQGTDLSAALSSCGLQSSNHLLPAL